METTEASAVVESTRPAGRMRWGRALVRGAAGLGLAATLYLLAVNVLLATGVARAWLSGAGVEVDYDSAMMLVPGSVRMSEVRAELGGGAAHWRLTADRAVLRLKLSTLFRPGLDLRELHAEGVEISTIDGEPMAIGARSPRSSTQRAATAGLPSPAVGGIDRLHLEELRRLRVRDWEVSGVAEVRAEGISPGEPAVRVEGGVVKFASTRIRKAGRAVLEGAVGQFEFGPTVIGSSGEDGLAGALAIDARLGSELTLGSVQHRGATHLEAELQLKDGRLAPGSSATLQAERSTLIVGGCVAELSGAGRGEVNAQGVFTGQGTLRDVAVKCSGSEQPRFTAPMLTLRAGFPAETQAGDARWMLVEGEQASLGVEGLPELPLLGGADVLPLQRLRVEYREGAWSVQLDGGVARSSLTLQQQALPIELVPTLRLDQLREGRGELQARLGFQRGAGEPPISGEIALDGQLGIEPLAFSGKTSAKGSNAAVLIEVLLGDARIPGFLLALARGRPFELNAQTRLAPELVELSELRADLGALEVQGAYREVNGARRAVFLVTAGPYAIGVARAQGHTEVVLANARAWFAERREGQR